MILNAIETPRYCDRKVSYSEVRRCGLYKVVGRNEYVALVDNYSRPVYNAQQICVNTRERTTQSQMIKQMAMCKPVRQYREETKMLRLENINDLEEQELRRHSYNVYTIIG